MRSAALWLFLCLSGSSTFLSFLLFFLNLIFHRLLKLVKTVAAAAAAAADGYLDHAWGACRTFLSLQLPLRLSLHPLQLLYTIVLLYFFSFYPVQFGTVTRIQLASSLVFSFSIFLSPSYCFYFCRDTFFSASWLKSCCCCYHSAAAAIFRARYEQYV